jgi:3-phenylpropionate/trans-cinnamate dioxygenase ferredoxin reductase component
VSPVGGVVIVGAGPAGLATARSYREAGGEQAVTIFGAEPHLPYNRPPLTKDLLRGESEPGELPIEDQDWYAANRVEVRTETTVEDLDPELHCLTLASGERVPYDACVLATGSEPARLPVPGADDPEVLTVRTVEDALALRAHGPRVAVVGSGFIGCEAAASLAMRGADVTLITDEALPQATRLGPEVGGRLAGWLEEAGVELVVGAGVRRFERGDGGWSLRAGEVTIAADTVLQAVGVAARTSVADQAGLRVEQGAVLADTHLRASAADVLVAGDVAFARNRAAGRRLRVEHWGEALNQGEVAGQVLAGRDAEWATAPGFWSTIGDHTLKYVAWGDGYATVRLDAGEDGSFTAWYGDEEGRCVGALTHERDGDYELGRELVESGAPLP